MERKGYLTSREEYQGSTHRKLYRATDIGREGLAVAKRILNPHNLGIGGRSGRLFQAVGVEHHLDGRGTERCDMSFSTSVICSVPQAQSGFKASARV
ncbi:hypothetical protein HHA01_22220 [Halomonas halmophila]|uniref:Transcription regulator PadR N-terminal domain-containing protein n=1 Tax=Halomonas halmophila TaxID=252 RepID=A0A4Y4F3G5_9GAMM|nr:hypothetical protein HHA01_22220 [Halomonas halmophila]